MSKFRGSVYEFGKIHMVFYQKRIKTVSDDRIESVVISRVALEAAVRRHLLSMYPQDQGRLNYRTNTTVTRLVMTPDGKRVTAVYLKSGQHVACDIVLDASGISTRAPKWLQDIQDPETGEPLKVPVKSYDPMPVYSSATYRISDEAVAAGIPPFVILSSQPNKTYRGCYISRVDSHTILLGISSMADPQWQAPMDDEAVASALEECNFFLPDDERGNKIMADPAFKSNRNRLFAYMGILERTSPCFTFRPTIRMNLYEKIAKKLPENFAAVGDAVAAYNPFYGQGSYADKANESSFDAFCCCRVYSRGGKNAFVDAFSDHGSQPSSWTGMTTAIVGVITLDAVLRARSRPDGSLNLDGLAGEYFPKLAARSYLPWLVSTATDYRYNNVKTANGESKTDLVVSTFGVLFEKMILASAKDALNVKLLLRIMHVSLRIHELLNFKFWWNVLSA
jgi:hypothetical protein